MKRQAPRTISLRRLYAVSLTVTIPLLAGAQVAGESVNMVSGTQWPGGDPFLQRQNEPSIAVSSANPMHLLAGANDYRTVDIPDPFQGTEPKMAGDAWQGVFKSYDGGQTWKSYLMPGYPQDTSADGMGSAGAVPGGGREGALQRRGRLGGPGRHGRHVLLRRDRVQARHERRARRPQPVHRPQQQGGRRARSAAPTRSGGWTPRSSTRAGPTSPTSPGSPSTSRAPARSPATSEERRVGHVLFQRSFLGGAIYVVWARIYSDTQADVMFSRSLDCGDTWSAPLKLNDGTSQASQGRGRVGRSAHRRRLRGLAPVRGPRREPPAGRRHLRRRARSARGTSSPARACSRRSRPSTRPRTRRGGASAPRPSPPSPPRSTRPAPGAGPTWPGPSGGANGDGQIVVSPVPVKPPPPSNDEDDDPCDGWKIPADPARHRARSPTIAGNAFTARSPVHAAADLLPGADRGRLLRQPARPHPHLLQARTIPCLPVGTCWGPDPQGRWYTEERGPLGERGLDLDWVLSEIDDTDLTQTRHTVDVRVAMATPATQPTFTSIALSRMPFGSRGDEAPGDAEPERPRARPGRSRQASVRLRRRGPHRPRRPGIEPAELLRLQDLQVNPPNLPMFKNGTVPFIGDYIDVQGPMFVRTATGWAFNTAAHVLPGLPRGVDLEPGRRRRPRTATGRGTRRSGCGAGPRASSTPARTVPDCSRRLRRHPQPEHLHRTDLRRALRHLPAERQVAQHLVPAELRGLGVQRHRRGPDLRLLLHAAGRRHASFRPGGGTQATSLTVPIPAHSSAAQTVFMKLDRGREPGHHGP